MYREIDECVGQTRFSCHDMFDSLTESLTGLLGKNKLEGLIQGERVHGGQGAQAG